mgnify:FL=1|tara:strand:+ start:3376 stop:4029 length:654 start_codon:yes stop_codon:yes gene_type:complete
MKLICEVQEQKLEFVTEAKEDGEKEYFIEGIFMQADIKNRNGRVYPVETLQKEVARYNREYVAKNRAYGELGHPQGPVINLDRVSHMIKELKQDGNNFVGRAKIMGTPMGDIVKNLMREGATLGVSSRGMGTLKNNKKGVAEVQKDFLLATAGDIVADPSAPSAFVEGIMEGVEWVQVNNAWVAREVEDIQKTISNTSKRDLEERKLEVFNRFLSRL